MRERQLSLFLIGILALCGCDSAATRDAKEAVKTSLRDPYSAQFSNVEEIKKTGVVCGEVNSKNSFGAFTGAKTFVYDQGRLIIEDDALGFSTILEKCGFAKAAMDTVDRYNRDAERNR